MIRVELTNAFVVDSGTEFLVLLRSTVDNRVLPISVGQLEAQAIAIKINKVDFPRPLTHDLFKNSLEMVGCMLVRVEVCDLRDDTFYAKLVLDAHGVLHEVDSRPSDAIALALRFGSPVFVDEKVMDLAGVVFSEDEKGAMGQTTNESTGKTETVTPESLRKKLDRAVKEERYEDAAGFRDELSKLNTHN